MAKRRGTRRRGARRRKMTALQRKYFGKRRVKPNTKPKRRRTAARRNVAKRKKGRSTRRHTKRTHRRRGRRGGGSGYALKPGRDDLRLMAATAAVGWLEGKAKADANFFLHKVPTPIDQLGWTGNLSLMAWVGSHFLRNPWLRLAARAGAFVTTYQLGRKGSPFSSGSEMFVGDDGGYSDDDIQRAVDAARSMGALSPDANLAADGVGWDAGVSLYGG